MNKITSRTAALALTLLCLAYSVSGFAQGARTYPDKPVRIIVGYSPGGLPDTIARVVAQRLGEVWKQQVIVDNRPGANGLVGAEAVARSAPDGYTLLVTDNSTHAIHPFLYAKMPFDPNKELIPVSMTAKAPLYLAVHNSLPAGTMQEMIALVKANPGKYSYGSSGIGSTHQLAMESLKATLGLDIVHVPYKGTGQSVPALVGGQVQMAFSGYTSLAAHVKDGRIKLLGITSPTRSPTAPNVPAIAEMIPGYDFAPTFGFFSPAGLPRDIVSKIGSDVADAIKSADVAARFANLDIIAIGGTGEEFAVALKADAERYSKAVKMSGAKAE
ncbi:MAG: tripartite tricarboxylate transporter substrate binding protein [Betaproteobacteria bacterium]